MALKSLSPPPEPALQTRDAENAPPATPPKGNRPPRTFRQDRWGLPGLLPPLLLGLVVLAAWQFAVQSGAVSSFLLPFPADVVRAFWFSLTDGLLPSYALTTLIESLAGCVLGALIALPLGYLIVRSRMIASAVQPYVAASQALPAVAIAPLIALWLGYGLSPVIALCALIVFFPLVITTVLGLRMLDHDILDAARVDGAGRWALLRHMEFPLALPSILAGLRASLTLSVTGAVVGEFVVGGNGLGQLLLIDRSAADSAGVFATLLMLALLAAALYGLVRLLERSFSFAEAV
ncbi:MAG: Hydroxymethylpyrimidine ABC transporter, transmembrane component [Ktedonobacterales bacterium]|jgi:NitT/TauT family transport system permease protein|nr:MAG: Hydroxymethylpyrimidine ABC transporter, transmembrane component [Ktedonobacterales bacterium]